MVVALVFINLFLVYVIVKTNKQNKRVLNLKQQQIYAMHKIIHGKPHAWDLEGIQNVKIKSINGEKL